MRLLVITIGDFTIILGTSTGSNIGTTPMTGKLLESNVSCNNNGPSFLSNSPTPTLKENALKDCITTSPEMIT